MDDIATNSIRSAFGMSTSYQTCRDHLDAREKAGMHGAKCLALQHLGPTAHGARVPKSGRGTWICCQGIGFAGTRVVFLVIAGERHSGCIEYSGMLI